MPEVRLIDANALIKDIAAKTARSATIPDAASIAFFFISIDPLCSQWKKVSI